jgi:hypothetical protein
MHLPIAILEKKRVQRIVFSIRPSFPVHQNLYPLMEKAYGMGAWCFDLPAAKHFESLKALRESTGDEALIGFGHLEAESGLSLMGKPLHRFEPKVISTVIINAIPFELAKKLFPAHSPGEVLTQREVDRMAFDSSRFEKTLSPFHPEESPFLIIGGKYSDWLLALGRVDLLKEMVSMVRKQGFIPIFSGQWATFVLPKAKPLDVAAYAIPINQKASLFDFTRACSMVKRFEKPILSLNPLAEGRLLNESGEALSFLLNELKVCSAIIEVASDEEMARVLQGIEKIPSLIPPRKT